MKLTPQQLQESLTAISEESFEKHQELADLAVKADSLWLETRASCKTDKECDRKVAATEEGKRAKYLTIYLKGLSHRRTAIISEVKANNNGSW